MRDHIRVKLTPEGQPCCWMRRGHPRNNHWVAPACGRNPCCGRGTKTRIRSARRVKLACLRCATLLAAVLAQHADNPPEGLFDA